MEQADVLWALGLDPESGGKQKITEKNSMGEISNMGTWAVSISEQFLNPITISRL